MSFPRLFMCFSFQLGIAVGFVLPPILVKYNDDPDMMGKDLQFMFYSVAGFTTVLVVLVLFCKLFFKVFLSINLKFSLLKSFSEPHQLPLVHRQRCLNSRSPINHHRFSIP